MPSNKDQGYFVRRLLRRAVREIRRLSVSEAVFSDLVAIYAKSYGDAYPYLNVNLEQIQAAIAAEGEQFGKTLTNAIKKLWFKVFYDDQLVEHEKMNGVLLYEFFTTDGFPPDLTLEEYRRYRLETGLVPLTAQQTENLLTDFHSEMKKHQELSRAGAEQKFKGGLADAGEITTMLHTCTHLMLAGLQKYLGPDVHQAGSNITAERTRFDFTYPEKVPREVLDQVEAYVNEAIGKQCQMTVTRMPKDEAKAMGVEGSFWEKYPDEVNVYAIKCDDGTVYTQELCGGPHVANTKDIKGTFKIVKEEASSAGVRRVKGVLVNE